MKIAQVVCVFPPYKGGIGMMAYNHARFLASAGHEVEILTPRYNDNDPVIEEREGFKIKKIIPWIRYGNAGLCPQLLNLLGGYDIVHLHLPFFGAAEFVWLAKKRNPKMKLVVTYHMDVVGGILLRPFFSFYLKFITPKIIKAADKVIVTSNDYAAHSKISKLFYSIPNKFVELPPEVDTTHYQSTGKDNTGEKNILFVGGMDKAHYFKGVDVLLKAFNILLTSTEVPVKLVLVGSGELQASYKKLAKHLQIEEHVEFAGGVSYADLPKYYSNATCTVLPSIDKSEAFGLVLIESLSCGTPIVASKLPGVRTVVEDGRNGYVVSVGKEGELASRLKNMIENEEVSKAMGEYGARRARELYDSKVIGNKLLSVYNSIQ